MKKCYVWASICCKEWSEISIAKLYQWLPNMLYSRHLIQPFNSIWRGVMRGTNLKNDRNEKTRPKNHFFGVNQFSSTLQLEILKSVEGQDRLMTTFQIKLQNQSKIMVNCRKVKFKHRLSVICQWKSDYYSLSPYDGRRREYQQNLLWGSYKTTKTIFGNVTC